LTAIVLDARKIADFGIGTYVRGLVAGLATIDTGTDYVLVGDPERGAELELPGNFRWAEDRSPGYSLRELWSLSRTARRAGAALFHAPHYVLPYRLPCPAVVTVHDLIHLRFDRGPLARLYVRRTIRRALRSAARTIAVSATTRAELDEAFGGDAARVVVVPNGVDERFRLPVPAAELAQARQYLGLPDDYLLFVGNPMPHKNLPLALAAHARIAARRSPPPSLVLCGSNPPTRSCPSAGSTTVGCLRSMPAPGWWSSRRAGRASACPPPRPWPPAGRWSPPAPERCPRSSARPGCWSTATTSRPGPLPSSRSSTTRAAGRSWHSSVERGPRASAGRRSRAPPARSTIRC
jgi:hypothetical protein